MDGDLRCNRLTCRRPLIDKAVVTTCSHTFCVECANELFTSARLCPACETSLGEPDDVVVCTLHPTNDYKTSVLSGLNPSIILEICSRAISFWQYQTHQENSFQHAVVRNLNEKNSQLQKQLESVVREADGEIALLNSKLLELERDLEVEKRKAREMQEATKMKDKEYQKLKNEHEKLKRRVLLGSAGPLGNVNMQEATIQNHGLPGGPGVLQPALNGMNVNQVQRTPIVQRTGMYAAVTETPNSARIRRHEDGATSMRQQFTTSPKAYFESLQDSGAPISRQHGSDIRRPYRPPSNIHPQAFGVNQGVFVAQSNRRGPRGFKPAMSMNAG